MNWALIESLKCELNMFKPFETSVLLMKLKIKTKVIMFFSNVIIQLDGYIKKTADWWD